MTQTGRLLVAFLLLELLMAAGARASGESVDVLKRCGQWAARDEREECQLCLAQHSADANPAELLRNADLILHMRSENASCEFTTSSFEGVCKLWAEQCVLVQVPPMPCLRHLRAPANALRNLRGLEDLPSLRLVDVSGNKNLGPLLGARGGGRVFFNAPELRSLNMSACDVRDVRPSDFAGLPKLEVLFLRGNHLQTLSLEVFQSLSHLRLLDVSDNPLLQVSVNPPLRCLLAVNVPGFNDTVRAMRYLNSTLALALKPSTCCDCKLDADIPAMRQSSTTTSLVEAAQPIETNQTDRCWNDDEHEIRTVADWKNLCMQCFSNGHSTDYSPFTTIAQQPVSHTAEITTVPSKLNTIKRNSKILPSNAVPEVVRAQITTNTANANLAVVVVSSVLSMLLVAQSVVVVFLLLRRRQRTYRGEAQEVPPTWPVTDLDDDLIYSSINPEYETIPEKP